jgi:hypothetical protein
MLSLVHMSPRMLFKICNTNSIAYLLIIRIQCVSCGLEGLMIAEI